ERGSGSRRVESESEHHQLERSIPQEGRAQGSVGQSVQVSLLSGPERRVRPLVRGRRWGAGWRRRERGYHLMGRQSKVDARGFTPLELIVPLVVVAVAVGLIAPAIGRSTESLRVRAEVAGFSATFRHAREQAITLRQVFTVLVNPTRHQLIVTTGEDEV